MVKRIWIVLSVALIIVLLGLYIAGFFTPTPKASGPSTPATKITYDNLASVLGKNQLVWAIPKDGSILLQFYNFNSGSREIEKSFLLTTANIKEGIAPADITIQIHSKYMKDLTDRNLCSTIQKARSTGDLGTETSLSNAALLWKYKSMVQYRDCLGF